MPPATSTKVTRGLYLTTETLENLRDASWKTGLTMSELFRQGAAKVIDDPTILHTFGADPGNGDRHFQFVIDPADWVALNLAARGQRMNVSSASRRIVVAASERAE